MDTIIQTLGNIIGTLILLYLTYKLLTTKNLKQHIQNHGIDLITNYQRHFPNPTTKNTPTQTINQYTLYLRSLADSGTPLTPQEQAHLQTHGITHNQFFGNH